MRKSIEAVDLWMIQPTGPVMVQRRETELLVQGRRLEF
jgi:hypothetical protein